MPSTMPSRLIPAPRMSCWLRLLTAGFCLPGTVMLRSAGGWLIVKSSTSQPGRGTEVSVYLPLAAERATQATGLCGIHDLGAARDAREGQATRDAHIGPLFETGRMKDYFQQRYLADFLQKKPEMFVDSVGSHSLTFQSPEFRHEHSFPALGAIVAANYTLVANVVDSRIYRRKDLIAP